MFNKKSKKYNGGEMAFGLQVLLFVLVIFIIWVLTGGARQEETPPPLIKPIYEGAVDHPLK